MTNENENIQDPNLDNSEDIVENTLSETEEINLKLNEANEKYARLFAEFDNYKKRTSKEKLDLMQSAGKDVIIRLLPVLDDFDRALNFMVDLPEKDSIKEGIELVNNKFRKTIEQLGVKEMDVLGQPFDAEFQEAITLIPAPTPELKNKVIDVVEKGYLLNDSVIRFAKVIVGQ